MQKQKPILNPRSNPNNLIQHQQFEVLVPYLRTYTNCALVPSSPLPIIELNAQPALHRTDVSKSGNLSTQQTNRSTLHREEEREHPNQQQAPPQPTIVVAEGREKKSKQQKEVDQSATSFAFVAEAKFAHETLPPRAHGAVCTPVARVHVLTTKSSLHPLRMDKPKKKDGQLWDGGSYLDSAEAGMAEADSVVAVSVVTGLTKDPVTKFDHNHVDFESRCIANFAEVSALVHAYEGEAVTKLTNEKIPYFNASIYLQNTTQIGKVDEIFGPFNESGGKVLKAMDALHGLNQNHFCFSREETRAVLSESVDPDEVLGFEKQPKELGTVRSKLNKVFYFNLEELESLKLLFVLALLSASCTEHSHKNKSNSFHLPATSFQLPATNFQLSASSYQLIKRLQSADHICKPLQKKRWTKCLQSVRRILWWIQSIDMELTAFVMQDSIPHFLLDQNTKAAKQLKLFRKEEGGAEYLMNEAAKSGAASVGGSSDEGGDEGGPIGEGTGEKTR
ncbi:hypothetical protein LXL04_016297 [Taraxacum kok-saghyz]